MIIRQASIDIIPHLACPPPSSAAENRSLKTCALSEHSTKASYYNWKATMPTRPARLTRRSFEALVQDLFYCPACSTWRTAHPNVSAQHVSSVRRRWNSTLVSSTAVNATKNIPPQLRGLHDALQNLQKKAPSQINQSRLQLALSGLATDKPATRIASKTFTCSWGSQDW